MKVITIQPRERGGVLPYAFHIDENGGVGRQDFWRGHPASLVGFQRDENVLSVDLSLSEFLLDPSQAVGMYPVMSNASGEWETHLCKISSVGAQREGD